MAKELKGQEPYYYYDFHPTQEDLMGETAVHRKLVTYLVLVLERQFRAQVCTIHANLNFYLTGDELEYPLAPDIAVIKGVKVEDLSSWHLGETGPAPQVVFEIASEKTWKKDLEDKPGEYGQMGVREYFAYDPNKPMLSRSRSRRLWGWQLETGGGQMRPMAIGAGGRLWSQQLESYLVADGEYLRLYDPQGSQRLTLAEAEAEARQAAEKRARAESEIRQAAERRAEALAQKLRSLGIDPDQP